MTDTTDPREGGSDDYPICEDECVTWGGHADNCRVPAAIRALEAKVKAAHEHNIGLAQSQAAMALAIDHLRADRDRLSEVLAVEQRVSKSWQETAEKFRAERDVLHRKLNETSGLHELFLSQRDDMKAEVARLTAELREAKINAGNFAVLDAARRAGEGEA